MSQNKSTRFTPLWMALCVVLGILVGTFYANHFSGNRLNIINSSVSVLLPPQAQSAKTITSARRSAITFFIAFHPFIH